MTLDFREEELRLFVDGKHVRATIQEMRILKFFIDRPHKAVRVVDLMDFLWDINDDIQFSTVRCHIMNLRKKMGPYGRRIETVRAWGYRYDPAGETNPDRLEFERKK